MRGFLPISRQGSESEDFLCWISSLSYLLQISLFSFKKVIQRRTYLNLTPQFYLQSFKPTFTVTTENLSSVTNWKLIDEVIRFMHTWIILFLSFCTNYARTFKFVSLSEQLFSLSIILNFSVFFLFVCYFIRIQLMLTYMENQSRNKALTSVKKIHEVITLH